MLECDVINFFFDNRFHPACSRLSTIMDYDKIAVLDNGNIVEFGRPQELLNDGGSWFTALASAGDLVDGNNAESPDPTNSLLARIASRGGGVAATASEPDLDPE